MKLVISEGTWLVLSERKEVENPKETFPSSFRSGTDSCLTVWGRIGNLPKGQD